MISEIRVQALLSLIRSGKIKVDDIKNNEYKEEVKSRIENKKEN